MQRAGLHLYFEFAADFELYYCYDCHSTPLPAVAAAPPSNAPSTGTDPTLWRCCAELALKIEHFADAAAAAARDAGDMINGIPTNSEKNLNSLNLLPPAQLGGGGGGGGA